VALPAIIYSTGNLVITSKSSFFDSPNTEVLYINQKLSYNSIFSAYAASIFSDLGYGSAQSINLLAGIYVAAVTGNLLSLTYIDRVPRNFIMALGTFLCTVVLAIETALVASSSYPEAPHRRSLLSAAAAFIFLYLFTFNTCLEGSSR
jgi:hypothetical protein